MKRPHILQGHTDIQILQTAEHKRLHNRAKLHTSSTTNRTIVMQKRTNFVRPFIFADGKNMNFKNVTSFALPLSVP